MFGAAELVRQRAGLLLGGGALRPGVLAGMSEWLAPPLALALAVSSASAAEAGLNWHQHGATLHLGNHCVHCVCLSFCGLLRAAVLTLLFSFSFFFCWECRDLHVVARCVACS
eukprot:COSAG01_NODE_1275_length_10938_cov_100.784482_7_plen_113_part_00